MKTKIAAAVALACLSSVALAQSKGGASAGWYVGANIGQSRTEMNSNDFTTRASAAGIATSKDDSDTAWKLLLGYNFNENWALEGFYTDLGSGKTKYSGAPLNGEAKVSNDSWGLAVKGIMPLHPQWDLYGRLGWAYNSSKLDASSDRAVAFFPASTVASSGWSNDEKRSEVLFGVGVEYKPQRNWGIVLEYENYGQFGNTLDNYDKTGRSDVDMWSLGVVVRF
jgi:OOP family OmpA-OmpF porin